MCSLQVLEGHNEDSPEPSLLQANEAQFPQPFFIGEVLQPTDHLCGPPLDLLQQLRTLPVLGAPAWIQYFRWVLIRAEQRGTITSLALLATPLLMQPRILLAFQAARAHCWLMTSFSSIRTPTFFSLELVSMSSSLSLYSIQLGLPQPKCNTLHLSKHFALTSAFTDTASIPQQEIQSYETDYTEKYSTVNWQYWKLDTDATEEKWHIYLVSYVHQT